MTEVRLLANCVVGLGFSRTAFELALEMRPDMVGCDAGTADSGPAFLGTGKDSKSSVAVTRDLDIMMDGARRLNVPLVIGSCGGAGARPQIQSYLQIVEQLAARQQWRPQVALIEAEQQPVLLHQAIDRGDIRPLGHERPLTHADVDGSERIVGMMGAGPITAAIEAGANIVLAGRCVDPAIFASVALLHGISAAPAWHAAKLIDKGYLATTNPAEGSPVIATVRDDCVTVTPAKPGTRCTTNSVAAMTMYENADPFRIPQPTGTLDVTDARYEQLTDSTVRATGGRWIAAPSPSIKLEGARLAGYRAINMVGLRDPRVIGRLDEFLADFEGLLRRGVRSLGIPEGAWKLTFRCYGRDGVLRANEPFRDQPSHEVGLVIDVVASSLDFATAIAGRAGPIGSRYNFTGDLAGGGNFAYPFSPNMIPVGPVYEWSAWHIMTVADEHAEFRTSMVTL